MRLARSFSWCESLRTDLANPDYLRVRDELDRLTEQLERSVSSDSMRAAAKKIFRRFRKRVSAKKWAVPGKASNYIVHDCNRPGDKVILCCRVSSHEQNRRRNLEDQETNLRREMEKRGAVVVHVRKYEGSGVDPIWPAGAAAMAKEQGAKLVAETTDRFIRHPSYHSKKRPDLQAHGMHLDKLRLCTEGVRWARHSLGNEAQLSVQPAHRRSR